MATKITLSLPDDIAARLRKRAVTEERKLSAVAARALDAYLSKPYITRIKARRTAPRSS